MRMVTVTITGSEGEVLEQQRFELGTSFGRPYTEPVLLDEFRALLGWTFTAEIAAISPTRGIVRQ